MDNLMPLKCVNHCGKECCNKTPWIEHTPCAVCKETVMVWLVCSDPNCRHVFDTHTRRRTIQVNGQSDERTMYVCMVECVHKLTAISVYGLHGIDGNGKPFDVPYEKVQINKGE